MQGISISARVDTTTGELTVIMSNPSDRDLAIDVLCAYQIVIFPAGTHRDPVWDSRKLACPHQGLNRTAMGVSAGQTREYWLQHDDAEVRTLLQRPAQYDTMLLVAMHDAYVFVRPALR